MLRSFAGAYPRDVDAAEGAGFGPDIDRTSPLSPDPICWLNPDASLIVPAAGSAACPALPCPGRQASARFWRLLYDSGPALCVTRAKLGTRPPQTGRTRPP